MAVEFELDGQRFAALNGGPHFKFDEAISFQVHCQDQSVGDIAGDPARLVHRENLRRLGVSLLLAAVAIRESLAGRVLDDIAAGKKKKPRRERGLSAAGAPTQGSHQTILV